MPSKPMLLVLATRASRRPLTCVPGTRGEEVALERVAQRGDAADLGEAGPGARGGDAEADQRRDVLGAGAAVALLASAGHLRDQPRAAADPQRAGALRAGELVAGDGQQIDAERRDVERQLAGRLHGVGVEQRAARVGDGGELGDRLDGADLVVGVHHRDQRGAIGDQRRPGHPGAIDAGCDRRRASVTSQPRRARARAVCRTASCSMVLTTRCRRPDGSSASAAPRTARTSASVPLPVKMTSVGSPPTRAATAARARVEPRLGPLAPAVHAGGVAEVLPEGAVHGVRDRRIDRRRGVVVEVDRHAISMIAPPLSLSSKTGRHASGGCVYSRGYYCVGSSR